MILATKKRTTRGISPSKTRRCTARRITRRLGLLYRDLIVQVEGTADASTVAGGDFPPSPKRIKGDRADPESRVIESFLDARRGAAPRRQIRIETLPRVDSVRERDEE